MSPDILVDGSLRSGCTLDVFIRTQLQARGDIIDVGRPLTKLPLVEPITLIDEFDIWYFDHLRGLFELTLIPESEEFPRRWKLSPDTKINFVFKLPNQYENNEQTGRNTDRPSTVSLERFVNDVCEKENNGMAEKWLEGLRRDDLFTFDHLANLKHTEWNELRNLSMNGRKILKSYVDREKQMVGDVNTITKTKTIENTSTIRKS